MKHTELSTDEALNAMADNELSKEQRAYWLGQLQKNEQMQSDLCDIRRVKDLMQYAFPEEEDENRTATGSAPWLSRVALLLVFVMAGFMAGWVASSPDILGESGFRLSDVSQDPMKVLLYIGESDHDKFKETLHKAEALLQAYGDRGSEVYVVTSAGGVDMLRTSSSPVVAEIQGLKERYASLHFVACNNTLFNLKKKGKPVQLVKEAEVAPSAVNFVVNQLKKGWTYVAI